MNQTMTTLVAGLLGGIAGVAGALLFAGGGSGTLGSTESTDLSEVLLRLERIEASLERPGMRSAPSLSGSGTERSSGGGTRVDEAHIEALVARLEERLKPTIEDSVKTSVAEAVKESGGAAFLEGAEPKKKKMTLAEAAVELELSSEEEDAVRQIAKETTEEFLKLMAGKDGSVDDVRREFEEAKDDPTKRMALGAKYLTKIMTNLGGVMGVMAAHETKMQKAVGPEKANRLDNEFELTDLDPLGIEETLSFGD